MKDGSLPLDVYMEDASTLRYCVSSPYQYYLWIPEVDRILPFPFLSDNVIIVMYYYLD